MRPGNVNEDLGTLADGVVPQSVTPEQRRAATVTTAEHAIAGGWTDELGDVLDALGLRGGHR